MALPSPFGKYLLLERISVGGMAEVFKAKTFGVEGFEKIIAIKKILPAMAEDADFIQMFIDEAKIAGQLNHANICQILELGKIDDSHFIAMEYIWGKDLLQIQNRFRRLKKHMPVQMAAFVMGKVCEGLDYAHRKKDATGKPLNIIHRDVSPHKITPVEKWLSNFRSPREKAAEVVVRCCRWEKPPERSSKNAHYVVA